MLLDHDHAFSDVEGMMSQTTEQEMDLATGYHPTWSLIENIRNLENEKGEKNTLQEIMEKYNSGVKVNKYVRKIIEELKGQLPV